MAATSIARGLRAPSKPPARSHASTSADWRVAIRSVNDRPSSSDTLSVTCQPAASAARRAELPESSRETATTATRPGRRAVWHSIRLALPSSSSSRPVSLASAAAASRSMSALRSSAAPQAVGCATWATSRQRPRTRPITFALAHADPTSISRASSVSTTTLIGGPASRP